MRDKTRAQLLALQNLGKGSVTEIEAYLEKRGLTLKTGPNDK